MLPDDLSDKLPIQQECDASLLDIEGPRFYVGTIQIRMTKVSSDLSESSELD